jgi:predicted DsbA family dithiol-disulfide isomerase
MKMPSIKIAVVSDIVCPWCYIGKRRLEKAIESLSGQYDFEVAYYPFELNSEMPVEGRDQKKYLTEKFGGSSEYDRLTGNVTRVAFTEGLVFNYDKQTIAPNTRNAHRLVLIARENGKQPEMVEALFKAYFTDGADLSKKENLVNLAASVGLDPDKMRLFLDSDAGTAEVALAETELHRMGISGVPFYIINDKYGISGAQPTETFIQAFQNIGEELSKNDEVCDINEKNC